MVLIIIPSGVIYVWFGQKQSLQKEAPMKELSVKDFEGCVAAGYPVMESYPRACKTPDSKTFIEDVGNELEKQDEIQIENPRPNSSIKSPLAISGKAGGSWFFEASFSIKIYDKNENLLGTAIASTMSNWMTSEFVPFTAVLKFKTPTTKKGRLILEKTTPRDYPKMLISLKYQ